MYSARRFLLSLGRDMPVACHGSGTHPREEEYQKGTKVPVALATGDRGEISSNNVDYTSYGRDKAA